MGGVGRVSIVGAHSESGVAREQASEWVGGVVTFRFDESSHTYTDGATGEEIPHITGMLEQTGWTDSTWFTAEGSARGTAIHSLTARYDLGALNIDDVADTYKGWLLAWVAVMRAIRPAWEAVEVPMMHPVYRYGGRPDRVGKALSLRTIGEIKSGTPQKADQIQTALQAILAASQGGLPAEHYQRLCFYVKPSGRFSVEMFKDRCDFDEARRIIKVTC